MIPILAQGIGIFAFAFNVLSYQAKKNQHLYIMQGISGTLFTVHFLLLGDYTASALNGVSILRGAALAAGRKWSSLPIFLAIEAAFLAAGILTYKGILSIAITAAQLLCTATLWSRNGKVIRIVQFCVLSPTWMVNNIFAGSIGGTVTEILAMISILISFLRFGWSGMEVEHKQDRASIE
ncbi:MAG: YgjV family protein [Clostridia bacterium]|nr:YgjV family protein [Clostridia bacterium]